ncbi:MAG: FKBP-type peptidyl-prolyl cis-trans isomerase [Gammaproteobacteria bacterium]|nr:FKBP-type peptidyl-prolyl cis-trans isomerase [Gammaproteobacteria bacterium]
MNNTLRITILAGCMICLTSLGIHSATAAELKTNKEKYSYAIGYQIGNNLKREGADVDIDAIAQGIKDVLSDAKLSVSMEDMQAAVLEIQKQQQTEREARGEKAKKEGDDFLAKNKKAKGVVELPSGVQYIVVQEGKGDKPKPTDTITAHYKGTLISGKEFDSSYKRGQPATFAVNQVIPGWQEILPLMPTGSKWKVFIPAEKAYGARGAGADIGPNETLIFEVELLEIKK